MKFHALILALFSIIGSPAFADKGISVTNAWVREAPPGAAMLAAYMTISNSSDEERILEWVESMNFSHVMLHRSVVVDGMAKMIHQETVTIPANGKLELKPGSYHLMMPSPDKPMRAGMEAYFILHFTNGDCLMVETSVKRALDMP